MATTPLGPCDCKFCPTGAPLQYSCTIASGEAGSCTDCDSFNATFVLDFMSTDANHCLWMLELPSGICDVSQFFLTIEPGPNGTVNMVFSTGGSVARWQVSDIKSCLDGPFELDNTFDGPECNFAPSKVTVSPIGLPMSTYRDGATCLPGAIRQCQPGTVEAPVPIPFTGAMSGPFQAPTAPTPGGGGKRSPVNPSSDVGCACPASETACGAPDGACCPEPDPLMPATFSMWRCHK